MLHCPTCQGRLRRVHRTLVEKFLYEGVYECQKCHERKPEPRWYTLYLGDFPRCPRCGTYRLSKLVSRDKIDPMNKGLVNFLQYIWRGDLYHCRYCRVQFYDIRKPIAPEAKVKVAAPAATAAER